MTYHHDYLRRLPDESYIGKVWVHWSMTIHKRSRTWLNPVIHLQFREALLHTLIRYHMLCPVYVLMPDHFHLLLKGCADTSHQLHASGFFRRGMNDVLATKGVRLQKQGYENVLEDKDTGPDALPATIGYILSNPVDDGLVDNWKDWPYIGSLAPGYPRFSPMDDNYWKMLEKIVLEMGNAVTDGPQAPPG